MLNCQSNEYEYVVSFKYYKTDQTKNSISFRKIWMKAKKLQTEWRQTKTIPGRFTVFKREVLDSTYYSLVNVEAN